MKDEECRPRAHGSKYRLFFFFSSRRRHTRYWRDWSSDVCSSDLQQSGATVVPGTEQQLTFDGSPSVTLQPGEEVRSDAVPMELSDAEAQRSNVAVSLQDRKSTRLNSSHANISYAGFCLKKKRRRALQG